MSTNNIISQLDLTKKEQNILWDYNVSITESYLQTGHEERCNICEVNKLMSYVSPLIAATVPIDIITEATNIRFEQELGLSITKEEVEAHKNHFIAYVAGDRDIRQMAEQNQQVVDSDIVQNIDASKVIDSNIRSLEAQRLIYERSGAIGSKEYLGTIAQLYKFVEMKLKKNKEIQDNVTHITFADLLKIPEIRVNNDNIAEGEGNTGETSEI